MLVEVRLFANVDCGWACFVVIRDPAAREKKEKVIFPESNPPSETAECKHTDMKSQVEGVMGIKNI